MNTTSFDIPAAERHRSYWVGHIETLREEHRAAGPDLFRGRALAEQIEDAVLSLNRLDEEIESDAIMGKLQIPPVV